MKTIQDLIERCRVENSSFLASCLPKYMTPEEFRQLVKDETTGYAITDREYGPPFEFEDRSYWFEDGYKLTVSFRSFIGENKYSLCINSPIKPGMVKFKLEKRIKEVKYRTIKIA